MKAGKIIRAYAAIMPLMKETLTLQESYELLKLKKKLQAEAEIFTQQEMTLIDQLADKDEKGKTVINESGQFKISGPDKVKEYQAQRQALENIEIEWDAKAVTIHTERVRPEIMEALEGFIEFI